MVSDSSLSCYLIDYLMVTCGLEIEWKYGTEKNGGEGEGETFELHLRKNKSSS